MLYSICTFILQELFVQIVYIVQHISDYVSCTCTGCTVVQCLFGVNCRFTRYVTSSVYKIQYNSYLDNILFSGSDLVPARRKRRTSEHDAVSCKTYQDVGERSPTREVFNTMVLYPVFMVVRGGITALFFLFPCSENIKKDKDGAGDAPYLLYSERFSIKIPPAAVFRSLDLITASLTKVSKNVFLHGTAICFTILNCLLRKSTYLVIG